MVSTFIELIIVHHLLVTVVSSLFLFLVKISFVSLGDVRLIIRDLFLFHELITSRLHDILLMNGEKEKTHDY